MRVPSDLRRAIVDLALDVLGGAESRVKSGGRLLRGTAGVVAYPDFVLFLGFGNLRGARKSAKRSNIAHLS
jgi:hypothetical protein